MTPIPSDWRFKRSAGALLTVLASLGLALMGYAFIQMISLSLHTEKLNQRLLPQSIAVDANAEVNPENQGKMILISGKLRMDNRVQDAEFGIEARGWILNRDVSIYHGTSSPTPASNLKPKRGDEQSGWSRLERIPLDAPFPESGFDRDFFYPSRMILSSNLAQLGSYTLSRRIVRADEQRVQPPPPQPVKLAAQHHWPEGIQSRSLVRGDTLYMRKQGFSDSERAMPASYSPQVGDLQIRWLLHPSSEEVIYRSGLSLLDVGVDAQDWLDTTAEQEVTIIARQEGDTLTTVNEANILYRIFEHGRISSIEQFIHQQQANVKHSRSVAIWGALAFIWLFFILTLCGIRMGRRRSIFWEGWMSCYRYGSSLLLACLMISILYSLTMLYYGQRSSALQLILSLALAIYLIRKARARGRRLTQDSTSINA